MTSLDPVRVSLRPPMPPASASTQRMRPACTASASHAALTWLSRPEKPPIAAMSAPAMTCAEVPFWLDVAIVPPPWLRRRRPRRPAPSYRPRRVHRRASRRWAVRSSSSPGPGAPVAGGAKPAAGGAAMPAPGGGPANRPPPGPPAPPPGPPRPPGPPIWDCALGPPAGKVPLVGVVERLHRPRRGRVSSGPARRERDRRGQPRRCGQGQRDRRGRRDGDAPAHQSSCACPAAGSDQR